MKKAFKKSLLALIIVILGWAWGVQTVRHQIFPYYLAHYVKNIFDDAKNIYKFSDVFSGPSTAIDDSLIASSETYAKSSLAAIKDNGVELRNIISQRILLPVDKVALDTQTLDENEKKITATLYGVNINGVLASTKSEKKDCLVIYNQGHSGIHYYLDYHDELKARTLASGCDFLALSMLGFGLNAGKVSFPSRIIEDGKFLRLDGDQAPDHSNYASFYDKKRPGLEPLALFLSGHYKIISELSGDYKNIAMLGISGGGWYTTLLSGLIPSIDLSIAIAGSVPQHFRMENSNKGDYEQTLSPLWRDYDYWDFYFLGLIDDSGDFNRSVYLVYNNKDACCFRDPTASHLKTISDKIGAKGMQVIIDQSLRHSINVGLVFDIINRLLKKTEPPYK